MTDTFVQIGQSDYGYCMYCGQYICCCPEPEYDGSELDEDFPPEPDDSYFPPED